MEKVIKTAKRATSMIRSRITETKIRTYQMLLCHHFQPRRRRGLAQGKQHLRLKNLPMNLQRKNQQKTVLKKALKKVLKRGRSQRLKNFELKHLFF